MALDARARTLRFLSLSMACAGEDGEPTPLPIQPPVGDGRLGLCGACVTHCRAEPEFGESTFVTFCGGAELTSGLLLRYTMYGIAVSLPAC